MSLKNRGKTFSAGLSITVKLTILYSICTLLILSCITLFMLQNMEADLEYEDSDYLNDRLAFIRSEIEAHPENHLEVIRTHVIQDYASRHTRYLVRIQNAEGGTLLESSGMEALPALQFPQPVQTSRPQGVGKAYKGSDGNQYRLNAVWAEAAGNKQYRVVQVALNVTDEVQLMERYRIRIVAALMLGLVLAGGVGAIIARKGLQPVHQLSKELQLITASDLHQRLGNRPWPNELSPLTTALDSMLERLESSFARLTAFSSNLAHELRTPINNLRGEAEVALSKPRSAEEYRQTIESGIEEYERLSRMVSDIMFLATPEQGIVKQPLDAAKELATLVDYYSALAEERGITLQCSGEGVASADPRLFQRAVGNLIANALYYTSAGGDVMVSTRSAETGEQLVVIVDTGCGIPENELPLVFDRFYRSAQVRQLYPQGSGLGLAIVNSIMQLHGGMVVLTSELGKGTSVTLSFPAQAAATQI